MWFQNQRTRQLRQSRAGSANSQGEGPPHEHEQPPAWTQGDSPAEPTGLFLGLSLTRKRVCVCLPSVWQEGLAEGPMLSASSCLSLPRDGHCACTPCWAGALILGQRGFESSCPETREGQSPLLGSPQTCDASAGLCGWVHADLSGLREGEAMTTMEKHVNTHAHAHAHTHAYARTPISLSTLHEPLLLKPFFLTLFSF